MYNHLIMMHKTAYDTNLTAPLMPNDAAQGLTLANLIPIKQAISAANDLRKRKKNVPIFWLDELLSLPYLQTVTTLRVGDPIQIEQLNQVITQLLSHHRDLQPNGSMQIGLTNAAKKLMESASVQFQSKIQNKTRRQQLGKVTYFDITRRVTNYTVYSLSYSPPNKPLFNALSEAFGSNMSSEQGRIDLVNLTNDDIQEIEGMFSRSGYNTKVIQDFLARPQEENTDQKVLKNKIPLRIKVLGEDTPWHLSISLKDNFPMGLQTGAGFDFMQIVEPFCTQTKKSQISEKEYPTPRAKEIDATSYYHIDRSGTNMYIKASHAVYEALRYLLEMKGFDVSELRAAMYQTLPKRSDFKRGKTLPGQLTGYFVKNQAVDHMQYGEELVALGLGAGIPQPDLNDPVALQKYYSLVSSKGKKLVGGHPKDGKQWFPDEQAVQNVQQAFPQLNPELALEMVVKIRDLISGWVNALRHTQTKIVGGKREAFEGTFWWDMLQYTIRKPGQPESKIKPLQGRDIMWLYSQPSAILGDEAGSGKTIQAIIAADLRTRRNGTHPLLQIQGYENGYPKFKAVNQKNQELPDGSPEITVPIENGDAIEASSYHKRAFDPATGTFYSPDAEHPGEAIGGGKILVFTVNNVVKQFAQEVINTTGASEEIIATSIDDLVRKGPANVKWVILPYSTLNKNTEAQQLKENQDDESDVRDMVAKDAKGNRAATVARNMQLLRSIDFDVMILDECHKVKNPGAATSKNIRDLGLSVPYRWGLTATYAANRPDDLEHQAQVLGHPIGQYSFKLEGLGSSSDVTHPQHFKAIVARQEPGFKDMSVQEQIEFALDYAERVPIDDEGKTLKQRSDELIDKVTYVNALIILTDFYHRKSKEQIAESMGERMPEHKIEANLIDPDKNLDILATIEHERNRLYQENTEKRLSHSKDALTSSKTFAREAIAIAKAPETAKLAKQIIVSGSKVMIFSAFIRAAKLIHEELSKFLATQGGVAYISAGSETTRDAQSKRQEQIKNFKTQPHVKAYVFMIQSSGTGMDMPDVAQHVIINDFTYSPSDFDQVEGRADRVTRKMPLHTHYMVIDQSFDKIAYTSTQKKRDLSNKAQKIDKAYSEKLKNNEPVTAELEAARATHWELVKEHIIEQIINDSLEVEYQPALQPTAQHTNWLHRVGRTSGRILVLATMRF